MGAVETGDYRVVLDVERGTAKIRSLVVDSQKQVQVLRVVRVEPGDVSVMAPQKDK